MNPMIKKLAEEAEGTKKHVPSVWQFYDYELQKFAELIIKECADVVKMKVFSIATFVDAEYVEESIKEHFGIKELK